MRCHRSAAPRKSPPATPNTVTADLNPTTAAAGTVGAGGDKKCPDKDYFSGTILGKESKKPCGWGIIPCDQATSAAGDLSGAMTLELSAHKKAFQTTPPDVSGAIKDLDAAFDQLGLFSGALNELVTADRISEVTRLGMNESVSKIRTNDADVTTDLSKSQYEKEAKARLEKTYNKKRNLWNLLTKKKAILK